MQEKKGIDLVGMLIALVIFLVATGAGLATAQAFYTPLYADWLAPVAGIGIFLLLLITGVALQRRFRP